MDKDKYAENKIKHLKLRKTTNQMGGGGDDKYIIKLDTYGDYLEFIKQKFDDKDLNLRFSQWIYDIIDGKPGPDSERLLYEGKDFVLVKTMDMNIEKDPDTFHLLAFPKDKSIRSIRDLTRKNIPLLKEMVEESKKFITNKYRFNENEIEAHCHYPPGVLLLHIHFELTNIKRHRRPLREHSVNNIIENLSIDPEYYKKRTFEILLKIPSKK